MSDNILLGTAVHQSRGSNNLIIKLKTETRLGQIVLDKSGKKIGAIFDIFGPVESPFASVKLENNVKFEKIGGKALYLGNSPPKKKRSGKKRRKSR